MTTIGITGAAGRMGQRLIALAKDEPDLKVVAAVERAGAPHVGRDAGEVAGIGSIGVPITSGLEVVPNVLIDFTAASATAGWIATSRRKRIALVIGTTGLGPDVHAAIDAAAGDVAILQAANMSLGVNVLLRVATQVATMLGEDYDIEILESHHRFKKDAPSGTALALAEAIVAATKRSAGDLTYGRRGDNVPRKPHEIGIHAMRLGDEVGRHTVHFAALGERVELTHTATNRDTFARGALRAARWLAGQRPGRYGMADVLGIR